MKLIELVKGFDNYLNALDAFYEIYSCDDQIVLLKDGRVVVMSMYSNYIYTCFEDFYDSEYKLTSSKEDTHLFDIMYHENFVPGTDHEDDIVRFIDLDRHYTNTFSTYEDVAGIIVMKDEQ